MFVLLWIATLLFLLLTSIYIYIIFVNCPFYLNMIHVKPIRPHITNDHFSEELPTLPEHLSSPPVVCEVCYSIFSFICMLCRSLFVLLYFFLLAIVLSVLLRCIDSDYHFGIFKLFLEQFIWKSIFPQKLDPIGSPLMSIIHHELDRLIIIGHCVVCVGQQTDSYHKPSFCLMVNLL